MFPKNTSLLSSFVVNFDSNNNFTTIFDKFKNINKVSNDIDEFAKRINAFKKAGVDRGMPVRSLYKEFEHLDENVINTGKSFLEGNSSLDKFSQTCDKAKSATSKFSSTLKSVAANVGIMIAVTAAVKLAEYAWDKANTTVEEVTKRIDELSDSISTLESEYNSLREAGSENLTDAELARLDYLEDRIAREKELKELEEARLIREKYGNKFTDYFDEDNYNSKYNDFRETYFDGMSKIDVTSLGYGIDQNNQAVIDIGSKVDEYNTISEEIQTYIAQMKLLDPNSQEYIQLDDYKNARENELNSLIPDLQTEYQNYKAAKYEAETAIEEMTADLNNPNLTDRDKETIQGWISEYENAIKIADYYIGLMKGIPAVPVYKDTESYANWFGTLSDAEKEITTSDEFTQAIEEQKDKLDGAILSVEDYTKALQSAKDALGFDDETTDLWDYSDTIAQLDTIKDKFDTLDKTYSKLFDSDKQIGFEDYSSISGKRKIFLR